MGVAPKLAMMASAASGPGAPSASTGTSAKLSPGRLQEHRELREPLWEPLWDRLCEPQWGRSWEALWEDRGALWAPGLYG